MGHEAKTREHLVLELNKLQQWVAALELEKAQLESAKAPLEEIEQKNKFLADIIRLSSQPVGVGYPDGRVGLVNRAFEQLTGYSMAELQSINWAANLTPPEWLPMEKARLAELHCTGKPVRYEKEYIRKDGSRVPVELLVHLITDPDGKSEYYYSYITDITERKQAEELLLQSERRFRSIMDQAADSIFLHDILGRLLDVNQQACQTLGYTKEELVRLYITDIDPEAIAGGKGQLWDKVAKGERFIFESRQRRKDGSMFPVEVTLGPIEADGETLILGIVRDITQRKQAEEALRESEARLRTLYETVQAGVVLQNRNGEIIHVNQTGCDILAMSHAEIMGKTSMSPEWHMVLEDGSLVPGEEHPAMITLRTGQPVRNAVRGLYADDPEKTRWLLINTEPIQDSSTGKMQEVTTTFLDITKVKLVEAALRQSEKLYRLLAENASDTIWMMRLDGTFTYHSPSVMNLRGYTPEEANQITLDQTFTPASLSLIHDIFLEESEKLIAKRWLDRNIELEMYRKDGSDIWTEVSVRAVRDSEGNVTALQGSTRDITERKQAEKSLRHSEAFLKSIIEHSPYAMWIADSQGTLIRLNQAFRTLLGISDADVVGKYNVFCDNIVAEQNVLPLIRQVFDKGQSARFILHYDSSRLQYLKLPETADVILDVSMSPVLDNRGRVVNVIIQSCNITAQVQAETALKESERFIRNSFDSLSLHLVVLDGRGTIIYVNSAWEDFARQNGIDESFLGQNYLKICDAAKGDWSEEAPQVAAGIRSILAGERDNFSLEYPCHSPDEHLFFIIRVSRFRGEGPVRVVVAHENITARKQAEVAIEESEKRFLDVMYASEDAIMLIDGEMFVDFNEAAVRMLEYSSRDDLLMTHPSELSPAEQPDGRSSFEKANAMIQAAFDKGYHRFEWIHRKAGGEDFPVEVSLTAITYRGKSILHCLWRDLTEKKQAEKAIAEQNRKLEQEIRERRQAEDEKTALEGKLVQSQKMEAIGTLAGGIAHDFNNMLWAIMGFTELSLQEVPKGSHLANNLQQVVKASERARDLVNQILTFSRKTDQARKPLQIALIVKEALKLLRATIPTTIEIKQDISSPEAKVLADPTQMQQLIMNLCTNSAHAMREKGGILEVRLEEKYLEKGNLWQYPDLSPEPYVILTVSDTGHGIAPEYLDRVFEPFFTTKEVGQGTGMGLSVVYGIVKSHGGGITVTSQPEAGTSFTILLPEIASSDAEVKEVTAPAPRGHGRLLVIDDEKILVDLTKKMLETLGYEVVAANSSLEALNIFQAQPDNFDLIITDQTMPHLTGLQLAQEVRRIRPDIPIILCTGFSDKVSAEIVRAGGIKELLMKPITRRNLGNSFCKALDKKNM